MQSYLACKELNHITAVVPTKSDSDVCFVYKNNFQVGPTFPIFPTFPYFFLICSYFSLLFHENALLSLLFHPKMSFTRKNPEIFPRSLHSLRFL